MDIKQEYRRWRSRIPKDSFLKQELDEIEENEAEIKDRFYRDLEFGTGGLRGKMGAGSNRINSYTVGRASQGLAEYLCVSFQNPSVCIAYDTRHMSREFAQCAAQVFCANGITVYLFDAVRPTPMLSFAVRFKKASAGIVITASHNPKEYNGYKVYGPDGGQITDGAAAEIFSYITKCDLFTDVKSISLSDAQKAGCLRIIGEGVDVPYYARVKNLLLRKKLVNTHAKDLKIIYSPLHGAGNIPVRRVLSELGYSQLQVVKEQELPDGDFPTAPYPNPEDPSVYQMAIEMARAENPDLIFATDPDCDRIGVLVKNETGAYTVLSGNQTGTLLCDYIIRSNIDLGITPSNPAVVKTIVTSDMCKQICADANVCLCEVLTGFKYIGELAERWSCHHEHSFLFGFEESYGYLAGDFVRDKDAVIAAALIAEMALYYKTQGMSVYQALEKLNQKYGYFTEKLIAVTMTGKEGQEKISRIISDLRSNYQASLAKKDLVIFEDYQQSRRTFCKSGRQEPLTLPKSNVLKFIFADKSWLVLRPSGTEPKIKLYLSAVGDSLCSSRKVLRQLEAFAYKILE